MLRLQMRLLLPLLSVLLLGCGSTTSGSGGSGGTNDVVLFLADGTQAGVFELFASDVGGANRRVISGPLVASADVTAFAWSPDRTLAAFVADRDTDGQSELYVVDLAGGGPTRVSGPLIGSGDVADDIAWSDDSQLLAYRADANVATKLELFVTSPGGGAVPVSSATMNAAGGVASFLWQPGGAQLAHLTDNSGAGTLRVNLVSATGAGPFEIGSAGPQDDYRWAPDGSRLAFRVDALNSGRFGLSTINPTGGGLLDVSNNLGAANANVSVASYDWRFDGVRLAFVADRDADELYEGHAVDALGSGLVEIALASGGNDVLDLVYSPSGSLVAYRRTDPATLLPQLHVVSDAGGADTVLVEDDGVLGVTSYAWSPDGNRIAYLADHNVNGASDLFNVLVVGGPPAIDLMTSVGTGEQVFDFVWCPDSARLLLTSDDDAPGVGIRDLFHAVVGGSTDRRTTNASAANDVEQYGYSADGASSVWIDGLTLLDPQHLFTGNRGAGEALNVTLTLDPPLGEVQRFEAR